MSSKPECILKCGAGFCGWPCILGGYTSLSLLLHSWGIGILPYFGIYRCVFFRKGCTCDGWFLRILAPIMGTLLENLTFRLSESQSVRLADCDKIRVSKCQSVQVSECHIVIVSECHNIRMSESQSARMSECQEVRVSECQNVIVS